eukprot:6265591-Amphidinium_carterae.1
MTVTHKTLLLHEVSCALHWCAGKVSFPHANPNFAGSDQTLAIYLPIGLVQMAYTQIAAATP